MELPDSQVELLDIDNKALEVAKINVDLFTPTLDITKSDLLEASVRLPEILLCNLPYVPDGYQVDRSVLHEPRLAIFETKTKHGSEN